MAIDAKDLELPGPRNSLDVIVNPCASSTAKSNLLKTIRQWEFCSKTQTTSLPQPHCVTRKSYPATISLQINLRSCPFAKHLHRDKAHEDVSRYFVMPPIRIPQGIVCSEVRSYSQGSIRLFAHTSSTWTGRKPSEHVTNQDHDHDIHAAASNSGQRTRAEDQSENKVQKDSVATSQKDVSGAAKKAAEEKGRKDWGLGLQDERGGVSRANWSWRPSGIRLELTDYRRVTRPAEESWVVWRFDGEAAESISQPLTITIGDLNPQIVNRTQSTRASA